MNTHRKITAILIGLAATLTLVACHVGDLAPDDGGTTTTTPEFAAEGLWTGTDSASQFSVTGIVDSTGKAVFIRSDGAEFTGTVQVSGSTLAAGLDGYPSFGSTFSDGTTYGVGTLNGTVTESETMALTMEFTTSDNNSYSSTWDLSFLTLSTSGATLAKISGTYSDAVTGAAVSITSDGVLSAQAASTGWSNCVLNGTVSVPDANFDVYDVSYTYSNCTGTWAVLNGVSFSGVALLNTNASPNQIIIGTSGESTTNENYGIITTLNRT